MVVQAPWSLPHAWQVPLLQMLEQQSLASAHVAPSFVHEPHEPL